MYPDFILASQALGEPNRTSFYEDKAKRTGWILARCRWFGAMPSPSEVRRTKSPSASSGS
ncbi:hypothetical protein SBV1_3380003 [Verrucomicrobia bacterium]|nr:hypothetical protein SBV1_3380003 [Verrucomicrobiota bacterium]